MKETKYDDWQNTVFYCEWKCGGWENIDPVYKIEEYDEFIVVYGGCLIPGNDDYTFYKEDMSWWKVGRLDE